MTRTSRRIRITAALLGFGLAAAACSSSSSGSGSGSGGKPSGGSSTSLGTDNGTAVGTVSGAGSGGGTTTFETDPGKGLAGVGDLPAPASAWPAASYDARHSSGTKAVGPQSGAVRWKHQLGGNATPGPVVAADGSVLAASSSGTLYDLNAKTGAEIWHYNGGAPYGAEDLSTSPAVLTGGTILWPGPKDTVYALSPAGKLLWSQKLAGLPLSPAVAGRNRVYVSDLAGHLYAFEINSSGHKLVWTLDTGGTDYASPSVGPDGTIYTVGGDGGKDLVAVRDLGTTGKIRWRYHATAMLEVSDGIAPDGTVVLGTNTHTEYGITPAGKVKWSVLIGDYTYSSSVVRPDGQSYFGDNFGNLWSLDSATGKVTGPRTPLGKGSEKIWSSPIVDSKGNVYWGSTKGNVYGYTADGTQLFSTKVGAGVNSYPAMGADGTLYVATTGGELYALGS